MSLSQPEKQIIGFGEKLTSAQRHGDGLGRSTLDFIML
jgi:hypothetical protein